MNPTDLMVLQSDGSLNPSWMDSIFDIYLLPRLAYSYGFSLPRTVRPASEFKDVNLGKLKALLSSWSTTQLFTGKSWSRRSLWSCLPEVQRSMRDNTKFLTEGGAVAHTLIEVMSHSLGGYTPMDKLHTLVKNSVKRLRQRLPKGGRVLLLGRDVWVWTILCQKMGIPYVYLPWVSRNTVRDLPAYARALDDCGVQFQDTDILFDTGFAGSIYTATVKLMRSELYKGPSTPPTCMLLSSGNRSIPQLFPNYGLARNRALVIEYLPKLQASGTVKEDRVHQWLSSASELLNSLVFSAHFWSYQSPAWLKGRTDVVPPPVALAKPATN